MGRHHILHKYLSKDFKGTKERRKWYHIIWKSEEMVRITGTYDKSTIITGGKTLDLRT